MKYLLLSAILLFAGFHCKAGTGTTKDYRDYHAGIINAEKAIFLERDSIRGLGLFKSTLEAYDFVFVDDCMEAFQLALVFKKEDYALYFIEKALQNGFELRLLDQMYLFCPSMAHIDSFGSRLTIHEPFMKKYKARLTAYSKRVYPKYLQRIDKQLLEAVLRRHVKEQLFKNGIRGLVASEEEQHQQYLAITQDNFRFFDSLARKGIFTGERNLGIYTDSLVRRLGLKTTKEYLQELLTYYRLPLTTSVPITTEDNNDYYSASPLYIMLFHHNNSFQGMLSYKDEAIRQGYLHPREAASLKMYDPSEASMNNRGIEVLYLKPHKEIASNTTGIDGERQTYLLTPYALDVAKHAFTQQHRIKLFFGFMSATR